MLVRRPAESLPVVGDDVEEVSLGDYDSRRHDQARGGARREAYHDDSDEDEYSGGGPGPGKKRCRVHF